MSSYRGADAAWDGGPPGAEADYAGQRPPVPVYDRHSAPGMPTTDPWTGVSYSHYGAAPGYEYQAYGAAAAAAAATTSYPYNYDSSYYQRSDSSYYGKYPDATAFPQQTTSTYEYATRSSDKSRSPMDSQRFDRRRSYRSKSRSVSPYNRRERDSSYEERRHRRSRSKSSKRKKYSSSDRSSSRSRSYANSPAKRDKKKRSFSSESSGSDRSYRKDKKSDKNRARDLTPPPRDKDSKTSPDGRTPSVDRSVSKSPKPKKKNNKNTKTLSSKDKKQRKVTTPPRKRKEVVVKVERPSLTPPRVYKLKDRRSDSPGRESPLTPPKTYARTASSSSKSQSRSPSPRSSKRKRSRSRTSRPSRSRSFSSSSSSSASHRSRSKSKRKNKRKSRSKSRSGSRRHSKSRGKGHSSKSPSVSKSRSRSRSSRSRSRSGSPSEDERRGQFTVADRKRFWKQHRNRQEQVKETKTPPKELKPPPGVVDVAAVEYIEYRDPPEVEGPNFAEMLPPPDQLMGASSSKSRPMPIPIKNDGSFLEMFKKMQEVTKKAEETEKKPVIKKPVLPFIGKRRGGRVLKTGLVKKAKAIDEQTADNTPKDAWSLYMQEVKKYRETSCEEERKTRPLVK